jgi:hypothetical protein
VDDTSWERLEAPERFPSGFVWCLHCERASPMSEWFTGDGFYCPYPDCRGSWIDAWDWRRVCVEGEHLEYPAQPVSGVVYPYYHR